VLAPVWRSSPRLPPSKYVNKITTDKDGRVSVTVQNISDDVNTSVVTLIPADSNKSAMSYVGGSKAVYMWICGSSTLGTTTNPKFLPGSCRGA
jgi:hypothetical protein